MAKKKGILSLLGSGAARTAGEALAGREAQIESVSSGKIQIKKEQVGNTEVFTRVDGKPPVRKQKRK